MSRPGMPRFIPCECDAPAPLSSTIAAAALTLLDSDVTLWLGPLHDDAAVRFFLELHAGVQIVERPDQADFIIMDGSEDISFEEFRPIDPRSPHLSTTLILQVRSLAGGTPVALRGPGIEGEVELSAQDLSRDFWEKWDRSAERFPRGVDLLLMDDRSVCGLPRTTRRARSACLRP
jgi:alpha-D-ribose 1-methylphosphonate 5-triphosphate synthase subunit PhnH